MTLAGGSEAHGVTSHRGRHTRRRFLPRVTLGSMQGRIMNFTNILSLLGAFVATSVVLGLLGAGLVMPAVGATGAVARQGVGVFDALPSDFTAGPLAQQSRILAADGSLIATPYDENRIVVPLSKVAPVMRQAQVAIEDSRFYEHGGVDPQGVARAAVSNMRGGDTQGASTLTQQYVKITLQENALRNNDRAAAEAAVARRGMAGYSRKLQELKYAVTVEQQLTKDQILQGYFNLVYYGDLAYGVEAAARHYFGVSASALTLPQAAMLAGLTQRPGATDPVHFPEAALARRNVVLDRMHELGLISDKAWTAARASKVQLHVTSAQNSCATSTYPYFCDYVIAWLKQQPALGKTIAERTKNINRGGLTIQTTIDPRVQKQAQKDLEKRVPVGNDKHIGAAAAVVQPGTGKILSMVQNTRYSNSAGKGKTSVNYATDRAYGNSGGFQFGSTAKMFAIATALKQGMPVKSTVNAPPSGTTFYKGDFSDSCKPGPPWKVGNDEPGSVGRVTLTKMTEQSINTAFVALAQKLGVCAIGKTMTEMGLHSSMGEPIHANNPANVVLGSDAVSPVTMASAYATVAAEGSYCAPVPVVSVIDGEKKSLPVQTSTCSQALDPDIANGVTKVLSTVLTAGTAKGNQLKGDRPASGKTGTTDSNKQSWFAGYTPQLSTAVWVGTPTVQKKMRNLSLAGQFYPHVFGATIAAPIWKDIMDAASQGLPVRDFADPSDKILEGDLVRVPDVGGMSESDARSTLTDAGFSVSVGRTVYSTLSRGDIAYTSPGAGSRAMRGADIALNPSAGYVPAPPRDTQSTQAPPPATVTPTSPPTSPPSTKNKQDKKQGDTKKSGPGPKTPPTP
jgi:membrane peptidoglycan carboxypeptidase